MQHKPDKYLIIMMGVSGCGKSTVARQLAKLLEGDFIEADDFHSPQCKQMMELGIPLTDALRSPWINRLCEHIHLSETSKIIMAYSGLRRKHRQRFRELGYATVFIWLTGSKEIIASRLAKREGHFMSASLLNSQFDSLQSPENENDIFMVDISLPQSLLFYRVKEVLNKHLFVASI